MTKIMRVIYDHAYKTRMPAYLLKDDAYKQSEKASQKQIEWLKQQLSEKERQRLEDLLAEITLVHAVELEAAFQAGFALGQELSRT